MDKYNYEDILHGVAASCKVGELDIFKASEIVARTTNKTKEETLADLLHHKTACASCRMRS